MCVGKLYMLKCFNNYTYVLIKLKILKTINKINKTWKFHVKYIILL